MQSKKAMDQEMTWARAIVLAILISSILTVTLGFIPSIIRYEWESNSDTIASFVRDKTGYEFKDPYTLVRIHDAISMGYQTVAFAIPVVATYVIMEKRRRKSGQRGAPSVKGYLPGK